MSLIDSVKLALRVNNSAINPAVTENIAWAKAELVRVGVPSDVVASDSNPLISKAIVTGVLSEMLDDKDACERAKESWEFQKDALRKHVWPSAEVTADVQ